MQSNGAAQSSPKSVEGSSGSSSSATSSRPISRFRGSNRGFSGRTEGTRLCRRKESDCRVAFCRWRIRPASRAYQSAHSIEDRCSCRGFDSGCKSRACGDYDHSYRDRIGRRPCRQWIRRESFEARRKYHRSVKRRWRRQREVCRAAACCRTLGALQC